jgi:hypothetical protein
VTPPTSPPAANTASTIRPLIARHHLKFQLIACAIETYGAFGTKFTKMIKTISGTIDHRQGFGLLPSVACCYLRTRRIGIALQRGIISDQLARAHARRTLAEHGALPSGCDSPLYEGLSA